MSTENRARNFSARPAPARAARPMMKAIPVSRSRALAARRVRRSAPLEHEVDAFPQARHQRREAPREDQEVQGAGGLGVAGQGGHLGQHHIARARDRLADQLGGLGHGRLGGADRHAQQVGQQEHGGDQGQRAVEGQGRGLAQVGVADEGGRGLAQDHPAAPRQFGRPGAALLGWGGHGHDHPLCGGPSQPLTTTVALALAWGSRVETAVTW